MVDIVYVSGNINIIIMIGALVGAAVAIGSGIAGGVKKRKAIKKQRKILDSRMNENDNWYNAEYYKDALDNPESRSYLKNLSTRLYGDGKGNENSAIATNVTHGNTLAAKQAANEVMSEAISDTVARQSAQKNEVRRQYLANKQSLQNGQMDLYQQQADNWASTANAVGGAAMSLGGALDSAGVFKAKPGAKTGR